MLKLNAGFSRKVGEANYGSRGATVNIELEVESNLAGDPDGLMCRVRSLFDLARKSVDDELNADAGSRSETSTQKPSTNGQSPRGRAATMSQLRAIRAICKSQNRDAGQLANQKFSVADLNELTLQEASSLIDDLKSMASNGTNGGGR
ncbi:MAG: hypothetical protein GXP29_01965 [Planctomycetes bacterium]|nr:hypothetical protein [Planctomycetota bacterium]